MGSADLPEPALLTRISAVPYSDLILDQSSWTALSSQMSIACVNVLTLGFIFSISSAASARFEAFLATRTIAFASALANEAVKAY